MCRFTIQASALSAFLALSGLLGGHVTQSAPVSLASFPGSANRADQTAWIQKALDITSKKGQTLLIPKGDQPYRVHPLQVPTHAHLILEAGTVLQAAAGYREFQRLLNIVDVQDVNITGTGAVLRMNKSEYKGGEYRHCVFISGSTGVKIHGLTCLESGGDGFYISGSDKKPFSEDVELDQVRAEGSQRSGLTVISARNLLVRHSRFIHSSGVKPDSGIDIEPQRWADRLDGVRIEDNSTEENEGQGIRLAISKLTDKSYPVRLTIRRHHDVKSGASSLFATDETAGEHDASGLITIDHFTSESPRLYGILFSFWNSTGPRAVVTDAQILNANQARGTEDNSAVGIIRGGGGLGFLGNVEFLRTSIRDTGKQPALDCYFSFYDYSRKGFSKIAFSQPAVLSGASHQHPIGRIQGQAVDSIDLANQTELAKLWKRSQASIPSAKTTELLHSLISATR